MAFRDASLGFWDLVSEGRVQGFRGLHDLGLYVEDLGGGTVKYGRYHTTICVRL